MVAPDVRTPGEVGTGRASAETTEADHDIFRQDGGELKELARLTAHAARGGFTVHALASGGYLLGRWGHSKEVPSLHALSIALRRMGVQA